MWGPFVFVAALVAVHCGGPPGVKRLSYGWESTESPQGSLADIPDAVLHPEAHTWKPMEVTTRLADRHWIFRVPIYTPPPHSAVVFLPRNSFSIRMYVDGRQTLAFADESQFLPRHYLGFVWHLVALPDKISDRHLYFHVYSEIPLRFVIPHVGAMNDVVRFLIYENTASFVIVIVTAALGLAVGLSALIRRDAMYAALSVFLICIAQFLFTMNLASQLFVPITPWRGYVDAFCLYFAPAAVSMFLERVMPGGLLVSAKWTARLFTVYAIGAPLLDISGVLAIHHTILPFNAAVVLVTVYLVIQIFRGAARGQMEARILAAGASCVLIFTIHDLFLIITFVSGMLELRTLRLHWGVLGFMISMVAVAAYRFLDLQEQLKEYSRGLASLVEDRTKDLNQALHQLRKQDVLIREELDIASGIQHQLLLPLPIVTPDFRLDGRYMPMHTVSGDFYDVVSTAQGRQVVLFADVTGHGVPAALIMSMIKAMFHESAQRFEDPSDIICHLNNRLETNLARGGNYATACVLLIQEGGVRYCNASHRPAVLVRRDRAPEWIDAGGMILGAFAATPDDYPVIDIPLKRSDRIFLYTDGIPECPGDHEPFGEVRLLNFLADHSSDSGEALCAALEKTIDAYIGPREQEDDITYAVLEITG